jgi:hypothetical protein
MGSCSARPLSGCADPKTPCAFRDIQLVPRRRVQAGAIRQAASNNAEVDPAAKLRGLRRRVTPVGGLITPPTARRSFLSAARQSGSFERFFVLLGALTGQSLAPVFAFAGARGPRSSGCAAPTCRRPP